MAAKSAKSAKLDAAEQALLLEDLQSPCTEEVAALRDCRWREKPRSIEFLMWTSQKWTAEIIGPCSIRSPDLAAVKSTVGLACRHLPKAPQNGAHFGSNASRQGLNLADIAPAPQGEAACPRTVWVHGTATPPSPIFHVACLGWGDSIQLHFTDRGVQTPSRKA